MKKKITRVNRKHFEMDENEDTTYQKLWHAAKAVLRGKCMTINTHIEKVERYQINKLIFQLKKLNNEVQSKLISGIKEEIIKTGTKTVK